MSACLQSTLVTSGAIISGAVIALLGNYYVQTKIQRHLRLVHGIDELKRRLYDFLDVAAQYWTLDDPRGECHRTLEAQILARKRVILVEFNALSSRNTKLKQSYFQTQSFRLDLWDVATGGCFQQVEWHADQDRVVKIAAEVTRIIHSINQAH